MIAPRGNQMSAQLKSLMSAVSPEAALAMVWRRLLMSAGPLSVHEDAGTVLACVTAIADSERIAISAAGSGLGRTHPIEHANFDIALPLRPDRAPAQRRPI